jgi:hypothetical protein
MSEPAASEAALGKYSASTRLDGRAPQRQPFILQLAHPATNSATTRLFRGAARDKVDLAAIEERRLARVIAVTAGMKAKYSRCPQAHCRPYICLSVRSRDSARIARPSLTSDSAVVNAIKILEV